MKLSFSQLEALLDGQTDRLIKGEMTIFEYVREWDKVMRLAGWTWDEFVSEIDKRWTTAKKAPVPLFQC
jgi:hypothetical protein